MRSFWVVLLALWACKAESPRGRACAEDPDCGPGYDCYRKVCTQVCTQDSECLGGTQCVRYRCVNGGPETEAKESPVTPPLPDATVTELRAIRRELELIRKALTAASPGEPNATAALPLLR